MMRQGPRGFLRFAAPWLLAALLGFVTGALPGPPLTAQGRYLVEVYDREVLESYVFRSPVHLALLALVIAGASHAARSAEPVDVARLGAWALARERALVAALALACGAVSGGVAHGPLAGLPHVQDERAYLFQARLFADGRLAAPVPPPPLDRAMAIDFTVQRGTRWYGRFPPGWPAVLSAGARAGAPWLVNPVLTVLVVLALHAFVRRRAGAGAALAVTALAAVSPLVTLVGASMMSHPLALVVSLAGLSGWEAALAGRARGGVALGLAWGGLALTRPHEGLLLALVAGLHLLRHARGRALALAAACGGALAALGLAYNAAQTGDLWLPPTLAFFAGDRPGFFAGAGVYVAEGHNLWRGLHNLGNQLRVTSDVLFAWPFVSLVPALIGVFATFGRDDAPARGSYERALAALAALYVLFLVAYHNPGFAHGTRFHYALLPGLLWMTAAGLSWLAARGGGRGATAVLAVVLYLTVAGAVTHYPRRLEQLAGYWRVFPLDRLAGSQARQLALVVPPVAVDGVEEAFASFEARSTPWPGGPDIVAAREGPGVAEALATTFPGRRVVRVPAAALRSFSEK